MAREVVLEAARALVERLLRLLGRRRVGGNYQEVYREPGLKADAIPPTPKEWVSSQLLDEAAHCVHA